MGHYPVFGSREDLFASIGIEDRGDARPNGSGFIRTNRLGHPRADDAGYYRIFGDGAVFASRHDTQQGGVYLPGGRNHLNRAEQTALRKAIDAAERRRKEEEEKKHKRAAVIGKRIYGNADRLDPEFNYFKKKILAPVHCRTLRIIRLDKLVRILGYIPHGKNGKDLVGEFCIVVPIGAGHELTTLEFIDGNGTKAFLPGGLKAGSWWMSFGSKPLEDGDPIGICEGVATALSIQRFRAWKGMAVAAAMDCGNLGRVTKALRRLYPHSPITIFGDVGNGSEKATEAASFGSGRYEFPKFTEELTAAFRSLHGAESTPTDFNDYWQAAGYLRQKNRV